MYEFKFLEYNQLKKEIMSECVTLENIVDIVLNGKPSKEQKKHLTSSEEWAKYAFENEYKYCTTIYENNNPCACIGFTDMDITIDFLDIYNDELIKYLTLVYHKFDLFKYMDEDKVEYFDNHNMFLGEIISYPFGEKKTGTNITFSLKNFAVVILTEASAYRRTWNTAKQKVNVDISHNFIRSPENYKDFEYLLDYQNNIKPEYFDLPDKPAGAGL